MDDLEDELTQYGQEALDELVRRAGPGPGHSRKFWQALATLMNVQRMISRCEVCDGYLLMDELKPAVDEDEFSVMACPDCRKDLGAED